jgi:hypothetical protein
MVQMAAVTTSPSTAIRSPHPRSKSRPDLEPPLAPVVIDLLDAERDGDAAAPLRVPQKRYFGMDRQMFGSE